MKRITKLVLLLVVCSMVMTVPAHAMEQNQRASSYFNSYRAYCYKASSTDLQVYFGVIATGVMDEVGANSITVQRSSDGTNWTTVKTYTKASYPQLKATDISFHSGYVSYTASSGYYYRAIVEFYARNNNGTGYHYYYTAKI